MIENNDRKQEMKTRRARGPVSRLLSDSDISRNKIEETKGASGSVRDER